MSEIANQLLARIEAIDAAAADNDARTEAYQRMAEQLADVEGRATSSDGVVTVVAGADGAVHSITFSDQFRNATPQALSASVLHTIAQARVSAARRQAEVVRDELGDTELLDRVLDSDERTFGDQRPQDPGPAPAAVPATSSRAAQDIDDDYDDYFDDFSAYNERTRR
ncbi:YbaB/EbfC family nucleoid-associated protein [Saccharopolyspora rosea]|uniref:YbaB/EbfC family nucleoid-associated protein n=1 Tax=Saccharopolyspora rosea TaxID=524884 RepID=UPI0021DA60F9|nr:YbaB/EbfC family nucleoid-associated protein [Saccharopolyspora rosea]